MSAPRVTERERVDLAAGPIHYRVAGPENGRPVVLVHGFLVNDTLWADVPERLGERGFRVFAPTWPLSQFVIDEDPTRIGRLVLTNCDGFDTFPPFPFNLLFRLGRHPGPTRLVLQTMRPALLRNGPLGFGPLVRRRLSAEETVGWIRPYLTDAGVRHDTTSLLRGWRPEDLADVATRLPRFDKPVLIAWAPADRFFKIALGRRLAAVFPDARLVEVPDARTFVSLDQPGRLADEIADFAS